MLKYVVFNKPFEVLCQFTDELGRKTLKDFIKVPGIYSVGRLDYDSEGLLLLTNDGELANRLMHPRYQVPRMYLAKVKGEPDAATLQKLRDGTPVGELVQQGAAPVPPRSPSMATMSAPARTMIFSEPTVT